MKVLSQERKSDKFIVLQNYSGRSACLLTSTDVLFPLVPMETVGFLPVPLKTRNQDLPIAPTQRKRQRLTFLPRDAMHPRYLPWACVRPSVCLSEVGVLLKRLNVGSHKQNHTIAQGVQFSDAKDLREIPPGSPRMRAPNAGGVGLNRRLFTNNRLYLENGKRQTHGFY